MNKFQDIKKEIQEFQTEARTYFYDYNQKMSRAKARYSEEVYKQKSYEIWCEVMGHLNAKRAISMNYISIAFEDIKNDFKKWMCKPINADLLATLNCVRNFEISLSKSELDVLASSAGGSYFGTRIVSAIARENGYFIKTPDMNRYMQALHRAEVSAIGAVQNYAGDSDTEYSGRDLLPEWENNGVIINDGKVPAWLYVAAGNYLTKDGSLPEVEKMWNASSVPAELTLTQDEQKRIYDLIKDIDNEKAKRDRIEELKAIEPDIESKIALLSGDYKEAADEYISSGDLPFVSEQSGEMVAYP